MHGNTVSQLRHLQYAVRVLILTLQRGSQVAVSSASQQLCYLQDAKRRSTYATHHPHAAKGSARYTQPARQSLPRGADLNKMPAQANSPAIAANWAPHMLYPFNQAGLSSLRPCNPSSQHLLIPSHSPRPSSAPTHSPIRSPKPSTTGLH